MTKRIIALSVLASLLVLCATVASAQNQQIMDRVSGAEMQAILQEMGYSAELTVDDQGDPLINSNMNGVEFSIYFYDCPQGQCAAIQYYAGFEIQVTPDQLNQWNITRRYGRCYYTAPNDARVEVDIPLDGGVTRQHLVESMVLWEIVLQEFMTHIGW